MIINAKSVAAYLLFFSGLAILFTLGLWQLNRGLEKASIAARTSEANAQLPLQIDRNTDWHSVAYRNAVLKGRWFTDKTMLLENRLFQGQPGYEVLVPFVLESDEKWLLVNRGWVHKQSIDTGEVNENLLTDSLVDAPIGQLYLPQTGFTLGESLIKPITRPVKFLYYDFPALSLALNQQLLPVVLVLNQNHSASFQQIWRPGSISAERHYAYTAQWWGLAITLFIFGLIWRRRSPG